jgi:subtilisin family serine protease
VSFDHLTDEQIEMLKGIPGKDGVGIKDAYIVNGELVLEYTDGTGKTVGRVVGEKGEKGDAGIVPDDYGNDKFANALTATKEGIVLRLDDVSPLSTVLAVKAEGAEPHTSVVRYGKNLFDFKSGASSHNFIDDKGAVCTRRGYSVHLPAGVYTFHAEKIVEDEHYLYGTIIDADGNYKRNLNLILNKSTPNVTVTLEDGDVAYLYDLGYNNPNMDIVNNRFNNEWNIQVEVGTVATPYEPYVDERPFEVLEDGVAQVELLYPTTTLMAAPVIVPLSVQYNRDTNKVIERLEQAIISLGGNV